MAAVVGTTVAVGGRRIVEHEKLQADQMVAQGEPCPCISNRGSRFSCTGHHGNISKSRVSENSGDMIFR